MFNVDLTPALTGGNKGVSIFRFGDKYQANVKNRYGAWMIGFGETPQAALDDVWSNSCSPELKPGVTNNTRRRSRDLI